MNMKKVLTGTLASVMAVSTMAVFASAEDITVDQSKLVWGDLEGNGNVRLEFYNDYGPTTNDDKFSPSVDPDTFFGDEGDNLITITFTVAGLPDNMEAHKATLGYGFSTEAEKRPAVDIKGNGTYTVQFEGKGDINGVGWLSVDIAGLAATLGIDKKTLGGDGVSTEQLFTAAKEKITISDVKLTITSGEASEPVAQDPAPANSSDAASSNPVGDTQTPTGDKNQPNTGVEGVAVVAGLAVLATGAIVIAKKRK